MTIENRNNYLEALGMPDFLYSQSNPDKKVNPEVKCLIIETNSQESFCEPGKSQDLLIKIFEIYRYQHNRYQKHSKHIN